ncbi:MAG: response regulator [Candidatus Helarchaeota archaeon]
MGFARNLDSEMETLDLEDIFAEIRPPSKTSGNKAVDLMPRFKDADITRRSQPMDCKTGKRENHKEAEDGGGAPLILLIEDNPGTLFNLQICLEFNGYRIRTAKNGRKALDLLKKMNITPDLILCDVAMPIMNGCEFVEEILKNPVWCKIPCIFLSARATPEDIERGRKVGIDSYITKPFREEKLLSIISKKLDLDKNFNKE